MLHYSLAKLGRAAGRAKGTKAELPPVQARLAGEKEYYAALRSMLAEMARETRESIIPLYQLEIERKRAQPAVTADADRTWFARLHSIRTILARVASNMANRILGLESIRHTEAFAASAKRALGIDLRAVVRQEDLEEHLLLAVARNAALIDGFTGDVVKRLEMTVYNNAVDGGSVTTLRKALVADFGIADRRAKLIARTETSKFNAELNKIRQQQAGVTEYIYMTSHDERVRDLHRRHDGKTFKWDTPPADGHPGTAPNCRCIARGIVSF